MDQFHVPIQNMNTQRFFSIGCTDCGGLQIGKDTTNVCEIIPVFRSKELAEMALTTFEASVGHPPKVIEIIVTML